MKSKLDNQLCFKVKDSSMAKFRELVEKLSKASVTGEVTDSGVLRACFEVGMSQLLKGLENSNL